MVCGTLPFEDPNT
jgi:serine/threonine protein kinase